MDRPDDGIGQRAEGAVTAHLILVGRRMVSPGSQSRPLLHVARAAVRRSFRPRSAGRGGRGPGLQDDKGCSATTMCSRRSTLGSLLVAPGARRSTLRSLLVIRDPGEGGGGRLAHARGTDLPRSMWHGRTRSRSRDRPATLKSIPYTIAGERTAGRCVPPLNSESTARSPARWLRRRWSGRIRGGDTPL
jgi:hypothetical protein